MKRRRPQALWVRGYSGSGKSCLVQRTLLRAEKKDRLLYCYGKYDQLRSARPYAALIDACQNLCDYFQDLPRSAAEDCKQEDVDDIEGRKNQVRRFLETALETDGNLLLNILPALACLLPPRSKLALKYSTTLSSSKSRIEDDDGSNVTTASGTSPGDHFQFDRLKKAFQSLFAGVSKFFPLVLVIDDLQWADSASVNIYQSLFPKRQGGGGGNASWAMEKFLFVGIYRDNELVESHPLFPSIKEIECNTDYSTSVHVKDLSKMALHLFITNLLEYTNEPEAIRFLSDSVHERTRGNIFFVLQFLEMLTATSILQYNSTSKRWSWSESDLAEKARSTEDTDVVGLVIAKMNKLPPKSSFLLLIASQLGSRFSLNLVYKICYAIEMSGDNIFEDSLLESTTAGKGVETNAHNLAIQNGFIVASLTVESGEVENFDQNWYQFSHDRMQQGAEAWGNQRVNLDQLRYRMGKHMLEIMSSFDAGTATRRGPSTLRPLPSWMILKAADLLDNESYYGDRSSSSTDQVDIPEMLAVVEINFQAAQISSSQAAFVAAAEYLSKCREVLEGVSSMNAKSCWESPEHYDLILEVYTLAAEMEYCRGSLTSCRSLVREIRNKAVAPQHKYKATYILIRSLGSEALYEECIELAYEVFNQAGFFHNIPITGAQSKHVEFVHSRAYQKLDEMSNLEILTLEEDDLSETRELCLRILVSLILFAWHAGRLLDHALVSCTLFLSAVENGLSQYSGIGFAIFGCYSAVHMQIPAAKRMFELVMHPVIKERYTGTVLAGATLGCCYPASGHLFVPFSHTSQELLSCYQVAMQAGDVEWAITSSSFYLIIHFMAGRPLSVLEVDGPIYIEEMVKFENRVHRPVCELYFQCVLNLMGKGNSDPILLKGEILKEYDMERIMEGSVPHFPSSTAWFVQLMLAYYFGDYKLGVQMAMKHEEEDANEWSLAWAVPHPFFRGLVYLARARELKESKSSPGVSLYASRMGGTYRDLMKRAQTQVDRLRLFVKHEMINSLHMLKILEAELISLDAQATLPDIRRAYTAAIRVATRSGFTQDAALASERFALYLFKTSSPDADEASVRWNNAIKLYEEWGAAAKAQQLRREKDVLLSSLPRERPSRVNSSENKHDDPQSGLPTLGQSLTAKKSILRLDFREQTSLDDSDSSVEIEGMGSFSGTSNFSDDEDITENS
mmetsp:Transcript_14761/g.40794  ORF Transcript_14761/g.40794 Transcript_14761/m.40794 type:complete len:1190 (+) Transcript_14761:2-3571(+)